MKENLKSFGRFNVRIVSKGERYGCNDCLVHAGYEPMVEFYDLKYQDEKNWKRGQFISRYDASEISNHDVNCGLDLAGDVPAWRVPPETAKEIVLWVRNEVGFGF